MHLPGRRPRESSLGTVALLLVARERPLLLPPALSSGRSSASRPWGGTLASFDAPQLRKYKPAEMQFTASLHGICNAHHQLCAGELRETDSVLHCVHMH